MRVAALAALVWAPLALSCAGARARDAPPPLTREPAPAATSVGSGGTGAGPNSITVQSSKGYLDPDEIKAGLAPMQAALLACFQDRLKERTFLSGDLRVQFEVQKTGQVGTARIIASDLGDWSVEHCVLGVARRASFAQPVWGDGTASFSVRLHFVSDQPVAVETWTEARVAPVAARHAAELGACAGAAGGAAATDVTVTLYIGNRGEVKAAGFSSPAPIQDSWADCAARAVASWKFTNPMGKIVKAAFRFPPAAR